MTRDNLRNKTEIFLDFLLNVHRPPDAGGFLREEKKELTWKSMASMAILTGRSEEPKFEEINEK